MKERAPSPTGFEHDRPYMKLDIWEPGEIEKKWGHDPATYPNQDLLQHYPTIQFNPGVDTSNPAAIDSNLNVHVMPHQPAVQTSRPGFQNVPSGLHSYESTLKVAKDTSNPEGIQHAEANKLPTADTTDNKLADPATKGVTARPGFQNVAVDVIDGPTKLAVAKNTSSPEGIQHAEDNQIPLVDGYAEIGGSKPQPVEPPTQGGDKLPAGCGDGFDGTTCEADEIEDAAAQAVDDLLKETSEKQKTTEELAREAAALEEALKKNEAP